jgi:hypothetical protein
MASLSITVPAANTTTTTTQPPPAPNTAMSKSQISSKHGTAEFWFNAKGLATRFQCALVKKPTKKHAKTPKPNYSACKSPKTYKKLKAGSYTFYVRAIGPGGTDKTPATHKFKIS